MAFKRARSPNAVGPEDVRVFDGVGGPEKIVLIRKNFRGSDISSTIANKVYDVDLGEQGTAKLRDGKRKIDRTGKSKSIDSIFAINLSDSRRYAIVFDGTLDIIDIPRASDVPQNPFTLTPADALSAVANLYPNANVGAYSG
jgi:hypothetical protein